MPKFLIEYLSTLTPTQADELYSFLEGTRDSSRVISDFLADTIPLSRDEAGRG